MNSQKAAIQQKYWICPHPKCITHLGGDSRKRVWKQREDVRGFRRKANKSHVIDLAIILESRESYHRSSHILCRMHFRISPPSNRRMRLSPNDSPSESEELPRRALTPLHYVGLWLGAGWQDPSALGEAPARRSWEVLWRLEVRNSDQKLKKLLAKCLVKGTLGFCIAFIDIQC